MVASVVLAVLLAVVFGSLGASKILAVAPMRAAAAHVNMSVATYRVVGVLEVLGAIGVLVGIAVPPMGVAAGTGLALLLVGAVLAHLRVGDSLQKALPACLIGALAAAYVVVAIA